MAEIRDRAKLGLDIAYEALVKLPGIILPSKPKGGMYAFFAFEGQEDSREACARVIEKARVGLSPGYLFGNASRSFLRMCVLRDPEQIRIAADRMVSELA